jgi:hypothetical protein
MSNTYTPQSAPMPPQADPPSQLPGKGSNGLATAGFVLSLLGLLSSWIPLLNVVGIILAILGAILAAVGLAKSKRAGTGKGLAIAGLVLGVAAVVVAIVVNVAFVGAVDDAIDDSTNTTVQTPDGAGSGDKSSSDDQELGTTRDNPAPLGSSITGDDWTVRINSVKTIGQDSMGQKAAPGSTLLVINLTASYKGDDAQGETPWATVKFVTADATTIDSTSGSTMFIADKEFDSLTKVYEGGSVSGDRLIEVPSDNWQAGVLAVSPGLMSDDTFVSVK